MRRQAPAVGDSDGMSADELGAVRAELSELVEKAKRLLALLPVFPPEPDGGWPSADQPAITDVRRALWTAISDEHMREVWAGRAGLRELRDAVSAGEADLAEMRAEAAGSADFAS